MEKPFKKLLRKSSSHQVLASLLKMIPPKTTLCIGSGENIRSFPVQPQIGLHEESRSLVVVVKVQKSTHKDSSGALQYTPDLRNFCFHVNERCICRILPYFNGRMLQIYYQQTQFL